MQNIIDIEYTKTYKYKVKGAENYGEHYARVKKFVACLLRVEML